MALTPQYKVLTNPLGMGLHQDGKRLTPQRLKVLNLFENIGSGNHLSAEEVHAKLIASKSKVSLATIYRVSNCWFSLKFGSKHEAKCADLLVEQFPLNESSGD